MRGLEAPQRITPNGVAWFNTAETTGRPCSSSGNRPSRRCCSWVSRRFWLLGVIASPESRPCTTSPQRPSQAAARGVPRANALAASFSQFELEALRRKLENAEVHHQVPAPPIGCVAAGSAPHRVQRPHPPPRPIARERRPKPASSASGGEPAGFAEHQALRLRPSSIFIFEQPMVAVPFQPARGSGSVGSVEVSPSFNQRLADAGHAGNAMPPTPSGQA